MEGSETPDQTRERLEREARELAEREQLAAAEAEGKTPLPDPDSEPGEVNPEDEHVDVACAGCQTLYGFDIKPHTQTFKFKCKGCGTTSEWKRI